MLLTQRNFPRDRKIRAKRDNLKKALAAYCQELADKGMISHCPLNRPTRPPNPEFGGMFQTDDCNRNNVPNERTKDFKCPAGFTARMAFRFYSPDSGCAASLSYCFNGDVKTRTIFGGMFQQRQDGHVYSNNPLTGGLSCPPGFQSHMILECVVSRQANTHACTATPRLQLAYNMSMGTLCTAHTGRPT